MATEWQYERIVALIDECGLDPAHHEHYTPEQVIAMTSRQAVTAIDSLEARRAGLNAPMFTALDLWAAHDRRARSRYPTHPEGRLAAGAIAGRVEAVAALAGCGVPF